VEKLGKTTFRKSWAKQLLEKVGQKALRDIYYHFFYLLYLA
jgi:hypothetical protein